MSGKGLTLQQQMIAWAQGKLGKQAGAGECTDLIEEALRAYGGKTLYDLGETDQQTGEKDRAYQWGTEVMLKDALPGDILQFIDHNITTDVTVTVTFADGTVIDDADGSGWSEEPRKHHSAFVNAKQAGDGSVKLLEQNTEATGRTVGGASLRTKDTTTTKTESKLWEHPGTGKKVLAKVVTVTKVTVTGTVKAYRAVKK